MFWLGPIGALTWNWSVYLTEWFSLRQHPWWRQIRKGVQHEFRDLDPYRMVMNMRGPYHIGSLAYGETPPSSVLKILKTVGLAPGSRVVDLGSGRGVPCLTTAALGYPSVGLEYFAVYTERSQRVAERYGWPARFQAGSFLGKTLPEAELYLISATAFPEEIRRQLHQQLLAIPEQAWVVSQDWILGPPFETVILQQLPVSWGTAKFCYHRRA